MGPDNTATGKMRSDHLQVNDCMHSPHIPGDWTFLEVDDLPPDGPRSKNFYLEQLWAGVPAHSRVRQRGSRSDRRITKEVAFGVL